MHFKNISSYHKEQIAQVKKNDGIVGPGQVAELEHHPQNVVGLIP